MAVVTPAPRLAHVGSLAPRAQSLLARFAGQSWAQEFYLAGAAALALHIGHRPTAELDLMTASNRLTGPRRRDLLQALLPPDIAGEACEVETARDGYLFVRAAGVGLRFFYYPYPLVDPPAELAGLAVASAVDLGLMKLAAIISRGSRHDFVDLYLLCRELPLANLLERAAEKFGHVRDFPLQALKGLADLSEAANEPMPRLALPLEWAEVERWLGHQVRAQGRALAGLNGSSACT